MNISEAARQSGLSSKRIRHYESLGLIAAPQRSGSGYRRYSPRHLEELSFIGHARELGFSLKQIQNLLQLRRNPNRASREVKNLAQQHLAELDEHMRAIKAMKKLLADMIAQCPGDDDPHCTILEQLDGNLDRL